MMGCRDYRGYGGYRAFLTIWFGCRDLGMIEFRDERV